MILFLKSASSRRVINEDNNQENYKYKKCIYKEVDGGGDNEAGASSSTNISLTVWRKSLLVSCSGFTVIDTKGNLVYRVDNYSDRRPGEIVLMDGSGKSVLTMRRHKTLRLVDDWLVYDGEASDQYTKLKCQKKQPICYVKKPVGFLQANSKVLANVYLGTSTCKRPTFVIEGSYGQRSCKIFDQPSKKVMAEIKRKEATNGCASFGLEVFQLVVSPRFDAGFAMSLVLLLDQMYS